MIALGQSPVEPEKDLLRPLGPAARRRRAGPTRERRDERGAGERVGDDPHGQSDDVGALRGLGDGRFMIAWGGVHWVGAGWRPEVAVVDAVGLVGVRLAPPVQLPARRRTGPAGRRGPVRGFPQGRVKTWRWVGAGR